MNKKHTLYVMLEPGWLFSVIRSEKSHVDVGYFPNFELTILGMQGERTSNPPFGAWTS